MSDVAFKNCFGNPVSLDPKFASTHLRRVMRRVKHAAEQPDGLYRDVVAIRDRARERGELARRAPRLTNTSANAGLPTQNDSNSIRSSKCRD
jgi:hypothetical protein